MRTNEINLKGFNKRTKNFNNISINRTFLGVIDVHNLKIWALKSDSTAISFHLEILEGFDSDNIIKEAHRKLQNAHGIDFITIQVLYN